MATTGAAMLFNTKDLLKIDVYRGEREKFESFKWDFYTVARAVDRTLAARLEHIEKNPTKDYSLARCGDPDEQKQCAEVYTMLSLLMKDTASDFVKAAGRDEGFMVWRDLCKARQIQSQPARYGKLVKPKFATTDVRTNMRNWFREVREYEERTGDKISDTARKSVLQDYIAPPEIRQHLLMNQSRLMTAEDIKQELEDYMDALEDSNAVLGAAGIVAPIPPGKGGGKDGRPKGKKDKAKKDKGKVMGKFDKSKGKAHKSMQMDPGRGEYRKFGGYCNWCWRLGHKEAACWFKQQWQAAQKGGGKGGGPNSGPPDPNQRPITQYFKRKAEDQADGGGLAAMEFGVVPQDSASQVQNGASRVAPSPAASSVNTVAQSPFVFAVTVPHDQASDVTGSYCDRRTGHDDDPGAYMKFTCCSCFREVDNPENEVFCCVAPDCVNPVCLDPCQKYYGLKVCWEHADYVGPPATIPEEVPIPESDDEDLVESALDPQIEHGFIFAVTNAEEQQSPARGQGPGTPSSLGASGAPGRVSSEAGSLEWGEKATEPLLRSQECNPPPAPLLSLKQRRKARAKVTSKLKLIQPSGTCLEKCCEPSWQPPVEAVEEEKQESCQYFSMTEKCEVFELDAEDDSVCVVAAQVKKHQCPPDAKPMVDSGSFVSTCPPHYNAGIQMQPIQQALKLESVLGDELSHYGFKQSTFYNSSGETMNVGFEVTDSTRPILSVRKGVAAGQMVVFGPSGSKIIADKASIDAIHNILKAASGFDIVTEHGNYVLDAKLHEPTAHSVCPQVVSEAHFTRALGQATREQKADAQILEAHQQSQDAAMSHSPPSKVAPQPRGPSQQERDDHEVDHIPFRAWCAKCVAGKSPDMVHQKKKDFSDEPQKIPVIEFDYSFLSDSKSDPESKLTMLVAVDSVYESITSIFVQKKGASDEYVMQSMLQYIESLGFKEAELKCDQEASTVDIMNSLIRRCKSCALTGTATPKGSKGSLGRGERGHLSVQGQLRTMKLVLEEKLGISMGVGNKLWPWLVRHTSWVINRKQPRWSGHTPYYNKRGQEYKTPMIPFGELCMFHQSPDGKLEPRWLHGVYVGRVEATDESVFLTPKGASKARGFKRQEKDKAYNATFLSQCRGMPWNPVGTEGDVEVIKGAPLVPGNRVKRMYISAKVIEKFGKTPGCPLCEGIGAFHSEACRARIEKAMLEAGDAFILNPEAGQQDQGGGQQAPGGVKRKNEEEAVAAEPPKSPRFQEGAGSSSSGQAQPSKDDSTVPMQLGGIIAAITAQIDEPWIDLSQEAWKIKVDLPLEKVQAGREKEVQNLVAFDAYEAIDDYDGKVYDMTWVEEPRGGECRSRLCVRQFANEKRDDTFAATPDTLFIRYLLSLAAADSTSAIMIVDISVAFMHARMTEEVVVRPPADIVTNGKYWRLKAAVNGTRKASQLWQEFSATQLMDMGFKRNDVNPCIFFHPEKLLHAEQHGDDFLIQGSREHLLALKEEYNQHFLVKKAEILSLHDDDLKEAYFLKRKISVDSEGWHLEMDQRYSDTLVERLGLSQGKTVTTPGTKEIGESDKSAKLNKKQHREYRGGAGIGMYMSEHRLDLCFATKELMREAAAPTDLSWQKLKRYGRYVKAAPTCKITFIWQDVQSVVTVYTDSDWASGRDRRSTSGGVIMLGEHVLRHWSVTQATISLSSGEAEVKGITRGAIEGLYVKHLLEQQQHHVDIEIKTDASAALAMCNRLGVGKRAKHLDIQILWVQQLVRAGILIITKVGTLDNLADPLTKHMSFAMMARFCHNMHMTFPESSIYEDAVFETAEMASPDVGFEDYGEEELDKFSNQLYAIITSLLD